METRKESDESIKKSKEEADTFPLHELPQDLLKANPEAKSPSIGNSLSLLDKKYLTLVNRGLFSIFQADIKSANELIKKFLTHVALGEKKEVEEMIESEPRLLLEKGIVKDEAGRRIYGTALRIALGAKDVSQFPDEFEEMAEMIKRHMIEKLPNGEEEFAKQVAEQFPEGYEIEEEKRRKNDLDALKKVFATIAKSHTDEDCEEVIEEFKSHLKKQTEVVIKTGYHFNDQLIKDMSHLYANHYDRFGGFKSRKNNLAAVKVWGNIQRYFPACFMQATCDGIQIILTDKRPLSRKKVLNDEVTRFLHPELGEKHFVYSYSVGWIGYGVRALISERWFPPYVQLTLSKNNRLAEVMPRRKSENRP